MTTMTGYLNSAGDQLKQGDYVKIHGIWWKLCYEVEDRRSAFSKQWAVVSACADRKFVLIYDTKRYTTYITPREEPLID